MLYADSRQLVPLTVRIPRDLGIDLKMRAAAAGSTIQLLAEHAYLLYLGRRVPKRFIAPFLWPEEFAGLPDPTYLSSPSRSLTVRLPRGLLRWSRIASAEEEITEQELALRVFDSYVRGHRKPPSKEAIRRDRQGFLTIEEPLVARRFYEPTPRTVRAAFKLLAEEGERILAEGTTNPALWSATDLLDEPEDTAGPSRKREVLHDRSLSTSPGRSPSRRRGGPPKARPRGRGMARRK
jgi:hypothetical protein